MPFRLAHVDGRAALAVRGRLYDLEDASGGALGPDPMAALEALDRLHDVSAALSSASVCEPLGTLDGLAADGRLGAPVPRPQKVFGVGLNYRAHAEEADLDVPKRPVIFTKFPSCLTGPRADVRLRSNRCDYEGELVVAIGRGGRDIAEGDAWDHVAGLMVGQDISDRRVQFGAKPPQFALGKSFDTFGPTGPCLVSPAALASRDSLRLRTWVNGDLRQDDTTDRMLFPIPALIAHLSRVLTLAPGDLLFTGTPEGVGATKRLYLADGDVIRTEIEGLGVMNNRCVMDEAGG